MKPLNPGSFTRRHAAHLLNRAGFGAHPEALSEWHQAGLEGAVDRLLDLSGQDSSIPPPTWVGPGVEALPDRDAMRALSEEARREEVRRQRRLEQERLTELQAWWLYRMRFSPRPLQEKLTLFWHGHFATGFQKVRNAYAMYLQNQTFRQHAAGNWEALLVAVGRDPAMLRYLDNAQSSRRKPNENWARELMELFSLGEGHYTEEDIRESARAFTGWTINPRKIEFLHAAARHDPTPKTFMGQTGAFKGEDIVRLILRQEPAAPFIVRKLWEFFVYPDPQPEIIDTLAATLRSSGYDLSAVLRQMFRSQAFYSDQAIRTQIKSPVQWLVQTLTVLDADMPNPAFSLLALRQLGQELFDPPNVKGWDGGPSWITASNLVNRYRLAELLVKGGSRQSKDTGQSMMEGMGDQIPAAMRARIAGSLSRLPPCVEADRLLPTGARTSPEAAIDALIARLFQSPLRPQDRADFLQRAGQFPAPKDWTQAQIQDLLHHMMSTPQYQLT